MWTKLPLSSWRNLTIYGNGIFVILAEFWVSELGDSRGYFGWKRPNGSNSPLCYDVRRFLAKFNCFGYNKCVLMFFVTFSVFFVAFHFFWELVLGVVCLVFKDVCLHCIGTA